ncbi:MAG: hypothetical protein V3V01_10545 [Acidimicrobiales bacterium]
MKVVTGALLGDLEVNEPTQLIGTVTGDVTVRSGVLEVDGLVLGTITVIGGLCKVTGAVGRDVVNRGGDVQVSGTVGGLVLGDPTCTLIHDTSSARYGGLPSVVDGAMFNPSAEAKVEEKLSSVLPEVSFTAEVGSRSPAARVVELLEAPPAPSRDHSYSIRKPLSGGVDRSEIYQPEQPSDSIASLDDGLPSAEFDPNGAIGSEARLHQRVPRKPASPIVEYRPFEDLKGRESGQFLPE